MIVVFGLLLEVLILAVVWGKIDEAYEGRIESLSTILSVVHRIFAINKTCLHYATCTNPGLKNTSTHFSEAEEMAITRKAIEIEDERRLDQATKRAGRQTRKNLRTIDKHAATSAKE